MEHTHVMNPMCLKVFIFVFNFIWADWVAKFNLQRGNESLLNTLLVITLS